MSRPTQEFKAEAIKLSYEMGVDKAAQEMGISKRTLATWRNASDPDFLSKYEARRRIRQLEEENAELKQSNHVLKETLSCLIKA